MADQNMSEPKFTSELLSPSELFAARSRSHKIPSKGQKDFFPDDSEEQKSRLQQSLDEHWSLISEERVERLGNLVRGLWIPSEQIVELQSPAGKFWQTMGFSAKGKQYLQPEEALYLMECGNLQVFHRELPLSIQAGYESFLGSERLTLQQYQVFGHLKRLGYVVTRFDPGTEPSLYERRLNLAQERAGKPPKRKRSASPTPTSSSCSHAMTPDHRTSGRVDRDGEEEAEHAGAGGSASPIPPARAEAPPGDRSWWELASFCDPGQETGEPPFCTAPPSRWDFSSIVFPDLGCRSPPDSLAPPDPSLLPGLLAVGACRLAPWLRRLDLQEADRRSGRERERRREVSGDPEGRRCSTWAEYRALRQRRSRGEGTTPHTVGGVVAPLHHPRQHISTEELLKKISVIKPSHLLDGTERLKDSGEWTISFNVYQPEVVADFKKSNPGKPYSRMCVCSFDGPVPDLHTIKLLTLKSDDVPVTFAVVDHGDISFYAFRDFHLPAQVPR